MLWNVTQSDREDMRFVTHVHSDRRHAGSAFFTVYRVRISVRSAVPQRSSTLQPPSSQSARQSAPGHNSRHPWCPSHPYTGAPHLPSKFRILMPNGCPDVPLLVTSTDARMPKIVQLHISKVELCWWLPGTSDQFHHWLRTYIERGNACELV